MAEKECLGSKPDIAVFADTGWGPPAVYENVEWLESELSCQVIRVGGRSLKEDVEAGVNTSGKPWLSIPVFLSAPDGTPAGMNWRQCTTHYKINPIRSEVRRLLGIAGRDG